MIKVLLLFILTLTSILPAYGAGKFSYELERFERTLKSAGSPPKDISCNGAFSAPEAQDEKTTLYSPHNRKSIELTVLSEARAKEIFNTLKNDEDNSFNYPMDGCYARAHRMATVMDDMGVVSGKAFVEGELYVDTRFGEAGWSYHVASLVAVKKNGKIIPTVFDPGLFDHPVPYEEWKALLLKKPEAKFASEYFTKRFNYDPDSRHDDMEDYLEEELANMKETIRMNARNGEMLDMMEKQEKGKK